MTTPVQPQALPYDPNDLGVTQRPGSYEAQLAAWAKAKVNQGADPDVVRARVGDLVHSYRASLGSKPLAPDPETPGDRVAGALSSAYQGLTMGAGNKITAGIRTALPQALGGTKAFDYPEALSEQSQVLHDYQTRHPGWSTAMEVSGSIPAVLATGGAAGAAAASKFRRALQLARQGAEYGAASGALSSDRLEDIPSTAVRGGVVGGVAGPAVGALTSAGFRGTASVLRRLAPSSRVTERLAQLAGAGAVTPDERASEAVRGALVRGGVDPATATVPTESPTSAMELGSRNVPSLARQARNVPTSDAAQVIDRFLSGRQAGTGQRVQQAVADATGHAATDVEQPVEDLIARRSAEAQPLYEKAYAHGEIQDPETVQQIKSLLKNPTFARAWQRGQTLTELESGNSLTAAPPGISPADWARLQEQGLDKYIPGAQQAPNNPTVAQVDAWKKGLDAVIESGAGSENALSRSEARVYRQKLNDVLARVDQEVPAYGAARNSFRGNSELMEAADWGAQHFAPTFQGRSNSAQYLQRVLPELSDGEQEAYRQNALNALIEKVRAAGANPDVPEAARGSNIVQRLMGSEDAGQKVRLLFPDQAGYDRFLGQMEQEALYPKTNRFLTGQSSTAAQLAESGVSPRAMSVARDVALAPYSHFARARLITDAIQKVLGNGTMQPAVADAVARRVTMTGQQLQDALRAMAKDAATRGAARRGLTGTLSGMTAATTPQFLSQPSP